jgi:hypothetical protein
MESRSRRCEVTLKDRYVTLYLAARRDNAKPHTPEELAGWILRCREVGIKAWFPPYVRSEDKRDTRKLLRKALLEEVTP